MTAKHSSLSAFHKHVYGLGMMMVWCKRWEQRNMRPFVHGPWVTCPDWLSQRFGIGLPSSALIGKHPFLCVQKEEARWMQLMQWESASTVPSLSMLCLKSKAFLNPPLGSSPIVELVLQIAVDDLSKLDLLRATGQLEARTIHWNEARQEFDLKRGPPLWSLPIQEVDSPRDLFPHGLPSMQQNAFNLLSPLLV